MRRWRLEVTVGLTVLWVGALLEFRRLALDVAARFKDVRSLREAVSLLLNLDDVTVMGLVACLALMFSLLPSAREAGRRAR